MVTARVHVKLWVGLVLLVLFLPHAAARASEEDIDHSARLALPLLADIDEGKSLFKANCRRCHGSNGFGDGDLGIPSLAGQRFPYLVRQLAAFSDGQRDSTAMHRAMLHAPLQRPQAWVDIAAYLREMPPLRHAQIGSGQRTGLGRGIYQERCVACHGQDARGDNEDFIPSLSHQHYSYLANQMVRLAEGHRHNADEKLVQYLQEFNGRDIDGVADYVSRMRLHR